MVDGTGQAKQTLNGGHARGLGSDLGATRGICKRTRSQKPRSWSGVSYLTVLAFFTNSQGRQGSNRQRAKAFRTTGEASQSRKGSNVPRQSLRSRKVHCPPETSLRSSRGKVPRAMSPQRQSVPRAMSPQRQSPPASRREQSPQRTMSPRDKDLFVTIIHFNVRLAMSVRQAVFARVVMTKGKVSPEGLEAIA